jgi:hypothetical protein
LFNVQALTILSPGSKSDKLAGIFRLYVTSSGGAASLEKYQLHCFVRCLLITLSTLAEVEPTSTTTTGGDSGDSRGTAVEMAALEVTECVFEALASKEGLVSFDDFADWYTEGGHVLVPWLELLVS